MSILVIYAALPNFPATDQNPNAARVQIGNLWVDYTGPIPQQSDIDAILNPDAAALASIDLAALNAELVRPGSLVRALALVLLARINAIDGAVNALNTKTALAGNNLPIFTQQQLVTALQQQMR
jgi:hypothetical protein